MNFALLGRSVVFSLLFTFGWFSSLSAEDKKLHHFETKQLTDTYYSEGIGAGDLNGDGVKDIVYGPYWFAGPDFEEKNEIYPPVAQDMNRYADNFFSWVYDFNQDGWNDIFVVGFPGTPAYVYENPKKDGLDEHWKKHQVFDWVSNESPQLTNLLGDDRPELVCTRDGFFGFATIDPAQPLGTWEFHPISKQVTAKKFGHGLGIGDVNGDDRLDIIHAKGWYEQPERNAETSRWMNHDARLCGGSGGAEMYAYDVDGDGDNDIITSDSAHNFGLSWFEQIVDGGNRTFKQHLIMGEHPSENKYGVLFSEPHSVALADIDGDGLKDIVTGKTYWSHHKQSPMWDAGAVVYWFQLVRGEDGVDWVPHRAADDAGIGRQVVLTDLDSDGNPEIVTGGMKGAHALLHSTKAVSPEVWINAQPKVYSGPKIQTAEGATAKRGPKSNLNPKTKRVVGAIEGETLKASASGGRTRSQDMASFRGDQWSNQSQLWWTGARPGDTLSLELPALTGVFDLDVVLTCARDYGIVQLFLDDQKLGEPVDLYETDVVTTGVLSFPKLSVKGQNHKLKVVIVGANPKAQKSYMFAIDYLRIRTSDGKFLAGQNPPKRGSAVNPIVSFKPKTADGRVPNLDFETGTLEDWTATGDAFEGQPISGDTVKTRRPEMQSNHKDDYWIGTYERFGDERVGTLTSVPFIVSHPYASFLSNGGDHESTRVDLIRKDSGKVFYQTNGTKSETMRRVVVDLRGHVGKEILVRLVDEHRGGWGHLNFDHFRLHAVRPAPPTPAMIELKADEYPHAGLAAQKAAAAMRVPEGFQVTVGAAEPEVKQPIAMALDDRGRVWIAEAYEYPIRAKGDVGRDRILVFEDTDGDGSLDQRKVFADGLNLVSGLEVGFGGVWVGAAPYLMFIPDQNGDDVPDSEPRILLDGWGYQDTHETLNAFIWGPDGWLYGDHGVFTHSRVGKPGTPDAQRTPINCGVWRYHPIRHEFEVFAHGTSNPWGVDFNDHGQAFITACVIPHLYHMIQGGRYQRQGGRHFNPYTYRDIVTIADHLHYLGATPHGGNSKSDSAGGGHAHSGAMIYLGDRWPAKYRNQLLMNNIHGQRLNVDIPEAQGSGYVGKHGDDFLLTGDQASQILNLRYGPDGNAWMIDWYDMQACHRREVDVHDRSNGRIYKISYGDLDPQWQPVDLASSTDSELASMVLHPNDWYVRHGRRLMQERAAVREIDSEALAKLRRIAIDHADDTRRLRAAWALHVTGNLTGEVAESLFVDRSPYVRGWAIQMAMENSDDQPSREMIGRFESMAESDVSPIVRLYLASAAGRLPLHSRWNLLQGLTMHGEDADDHNLPLMYWYAAEPLAEIDPDRALALAMSAGEEIPLLREFMLRRIGADGSESALSVLIDGMGNAKSPAMQLTYLKAIRSSLEGRRSVEAPANWKNFSKQLLTNQDGDVRLQSIALGVTFGDTDALVAIRSQVGDDSASVSDRRIALNSLLDRNDSELAPTLLSLLKADPALREIAIRGLAQYDDPAIAPALLTAYSEFSPTQRRLALGTLCARSVSGIALLDAIENERIDGKDLTADLVRQLQFHRDKEIDALLEKVWGVARQSPAEKLAMVEQYKQLIGSADHPSPDAELGRTLFAKTCMKCHILYGVGYKIGPDLTGSNRANIDYLLSNIVDPSSVMAKEYVPNVVLTDNGRVVNGLVKAEDKHSITIQTTDAVVVIPKNEIERNVQADKSMMPDDQLKQFTPHEVRSLIAYLRDKEQVPMLATVENAATFFNGTDLAGWSGNPDLWSVENGQLIGSTEGLRRNEWITNELAVEDFHLTVEVKLIGNAGNSGIQFRSRERDGEVSGYQADIGKGWWGKLYEEHGRALLWKESGEQHVKPDDWNKYEIIARGNHIRTFINGNLCVDLQDPEGATRGIIAFQLHSGGETEVRYRNMNLEVLPSPAE